MAAWQFDLLIVARRMLEKIAGPCASWLHSGHFDEYDWWSEELAERVLVTLDGLFARAASETENIVVWGDPDSNCIRAVLEEGKVVEATCRFDVRDQDRFFLRKIVQVASNEDWVFVLPDFTVIEPAEFLIFEKLSECEESDFVRDPKDFLKRLARRRK